MRKSQYGGGGGGGGGEVEWRTATLNTFGLSKQDESISEDGNNDADVSEHFSSFFYTGVDCVEPRTSNKYTRTSLIRAPWDRALPLFQICPYGAVSQDNSCTMYHVVF